jgi:hypothetical protein
VVVVGIGNSGGDIAVDASRVAEQVSGKSSDSSGSDPFRYYAAQGFLKIGTIHDRQGNFILIVKISVFFALFELKHSI